MMGFRVLYHQTIIFTGENGVYQRCSICPLKSKSVGNAFFRDLETQISKSPPIGDHHGGISPDTDLTNSKETLWEKTALDKSAWIKAYINIFIRTKGFYGITNLWRDLSSKRRLKLTHCLVESIETKGSSTNFTSSNIELI